MSEGGDLAAPSLRPENPTGFKSQVRICQHTTCTQQGSAAVLKAFQNQNLDEAEIVGSGCLGCCGNGPMVLVLPDDTWYSHVRPQDVEAIASQHLADGIPVTQLLDRQHHDPSQQQEIRDGRSLMWAYIALGLAVLGAIGAIGWTLWAF